MQNRLGSKEDETRIPFCWDIALCHWVTGFQILWMKSPRRMPGTGTGVPVPVPAILLGEKKAAIRLPSVSHSVISQQKGLQLSSDTTSYPSRRDSSYPVTQRHIPAEGTPVTQ